MKKLSLVFICMLATVIFSGCGYRIGSLLPGDLKTVTVPMFINKTTEPELESLVTNGVIQEFLLDGTLQVTEYENADTLLLGEIYDYRREPLRFSEGEVTTEYRVIITVKIKFEDLIHNEVMFVASGIEGETTYYVGIDMHESERAALPKAIKDLSHHVVEKVVEAGW